MGHPCRRMRPEAGLAGCERPEMGWHTASLAIVELQKELQTDPSVACTCPVANMNGLRYSS